MQITTVVRIALIVAAMLLILPAAALSQDQTPFTKEELDKFLADYPDFMKWAEENGEKWDNMQVGSDMAAGMRVSQEVMEFVAQKGWNPPQRFFYVMGQTAMGAMSLKQGSTGTDAVSALEQQRQMIANTPGIPDAQKEQALAEIDRAIAEAEKSDATAGPQVPPEEMALIEENLEAILEALAGSGS